MYAKVIRSGSHVKVDPKQTWELDSKVVDIFTINIYLDLPNLNLLSVTPLISRNPRGTDVLSLNLTPCCHISLP